MPTKMSCEVKGKTYEVLYQADFVAESSNFGVSTKVHTLKYGDHTERDYDFHACCQKMRTYLERITHREGW
jgi:hypothetical protein